MVNYNKLREFLADIEHQQWMCWVECLTHDLWNIRRDLDEAGEINSAIRRIDERFARWKKNQKPYKELTEEAKEKDREWADKILDNIPLKCPVYQCGGLMEIKERKPPKDFIESEHYDGDEQTPDLVCSNCGAIYQFQRFKNARR
jgi:hypothetical protein